MEISNRNDTHDNHVQHHKTPLKHFQPVIETQNTDQDSEDIVTRSREDEKRVFAVIYNLFPSAREDDIGIKSFYVQVKKNLETDLNNNVWVLFVWGTVYHDE